MSLGIVITVAEGVILATDTRMILQDTHFDNATKLLTFNEPHDWMAAIISGDLAIGDRPIHAFTLDFERTLNPRRHTIHEYARLLSNFYGEQWDQYNIRPQFGTDFLLCGYSKNSRHSEVFSFLSPHRPEPALWSPDFFRIIWLGQFDIVSRIILGYEQSLPAAIQQYLKLDQVQMEGVSNLFEQRELTVPYKHMALQDGVDLAVFLMDTAMRIQNFVIGPRGIGGTIEVASITSEEGFKWIRRRTPNENTSR